MMQEALAKIVSCATAILDDDGVSDGQRTQIGRIITLCREIVEDDSSASMFNKNMNIITAICGYTNMIQRDSRLCSSTQELLAVISEKATGVVEEIKKSKPPDLVNNEA